MKRVIKKMSVPFFGLGIIFAFLAFVYGYVFNIWDDMYARPLVQDGVSVFIGSKLGSFGDMVALMYLSVISFLISISSSVMKEE